MTDEHAYAYEVGYQDGLRDAQDENDWAREFLDRMAGHCGTRDCPSLVAYVNQLESENERMREELESWHRITAGIELSDYPVTVFEPRDAERENELLREKVRRQADELDSTRRALERRNGELRPWKRQAERLVAENAKLRELLLYIADMLGKNINLSELCEESANLRAENARLRKLLLDVWNDAIRFDGFWDYVMDDGELYNKDELPHYQERMRELGIEVNV